MESVPSRVPSEFSFGDVLNLNHPFLRMGDVAVFLDANYFSIGRRRADVEILLPSFFSFLFFPCRTVFRKNNFRFITRQ